MPKYRIKHVWTAALWLLISTFSIISYLNYALDDFLTDPINMALSRVKSSSKTGTTIHSPSGSKIVVGNSQQRPVKPNMPNPVGASHKTIEEILKEHPEIDEASLIYDDDSDSDDKDDDDDKLTYLSSYEYPSKEYKDIDDTDEKHDMALGRAKRSPNTRKLNHSPERDTVSTTPQKTIEEILKEHPEIDEASLIYDDDSDSDDKDDDDDDKLTYLSSYEYPSKEYKDSDEGDEKHGRKRTAFENGKNLPIAGHSTDYGNYNRGFRNYNREGAKENDGKVFDDRKHNDDDDSANDINNNDDTVVEHRTRHPRPKTLRPDRGKATNKSVRRRKTRSKHIKQAPQSNDGYQQMLAQVRRSLDSDESGDAGLPTTKMPVVDNFKNLPRKVRKKM